MEKITQVEQDKPVAKEIAFFQIIQEADLFLAMMPVHSRCVYCGDAAGHWDHVVPHSFIAVGARRTWNAGVLPACYRCNGILGNLIFDSLDERLGHVAKRMEAKHRKILRTPDWTDEEMAEISPNLRKGVIDMLAEKKDLAAKFRYLNRGTFRLWLDLYEQDVAAQYGHS